MTASRSVATLIGRCTSQLCASQVSYSPARVSPPFLGPLRFSSTHFPPDSAATGALLFRSTAARTQLDTKSNFTHRAIQASRPEMESVPLCVPERLKPH